MQTVGDLGEFGLIERLARVIPASASVIEGIGDDCALVRVSERLLLVSTDMSVENVHFRRNTSEPLDIGWKAVATGISDIAAMGGVPLFCLVSLACPSATPISTIDQIYHGMNSVLSGFGAVIVGGDTTRNEPGIIIDITVIGEPSGHRVLRRKGAQVGDLVAVSGPLGLSAAGLHALTKSQLAPGLIEAHVRPKPRVIEGQWLCGNDAVHAMIDISDGLVQDAGHIACVNGLGIEIDSSKLLVAPALAAYCKTQNVPAEDFMLSGGEDYELLFTLDPCEATRVQQAFHAEFNGELRVIGVVSEETAGVLVNGMPPARTGFDHFKGSGV